MFWKREEKGEKERGVLFLQTLFKLRVPEKQQKVCLGGRQDVPWITMYPVDIYYQMMFNWEESGSHHSKQFPSNFLTCKSGALKGHLWESHWNNGFPCAKWWHHSAQRRRKRAVIAGCLAKSFVLFPQGEKKKKRLKKNVSGLVFYWKLNPCLINNYVLLLRFSFCTHKYTSIYTYSSQFVVKLGDL